MPCVLGIDVGTQSLRVLLYDSDRRQSLASESEALVVQRPAAGGAEQDAGDWLRALDTCMSRVDRGLRRSVQAVAVSGQQHGLVALDAAGDPLLPVKLWCDTTCVAEAAALHDALGGRGAWIAKVGNPILPGYTAPKLRWLRDQKPALYQRLHTVLLPHDYLNFFLTGERAAEPGDASGTGLLDIVRRDWSDEACQAVDPSGRLRCCLPPLHTGNGPVGQLRPAAAARLGLPEGVPVASGGGDNMMGAIGTGSVQEGRLTVSLGTSGTLYTHVDRPVIDPAGQVAAFCSSTGGWLPLLCTMNCTVSTELTRKLLGLDLGDVDTVAARCPPGAHGLTLVPFFTGERLPNLPQGRACLFGLAADNMSPAALLRAAMEGATFALRHGLQHLQRLGLRGDHVVVTGGGSRSAVWRQILADMFAQPVRVPALCEAAAFGAALQALQVASKARDITAIVDQHVRMDETATVQPNPDGQAIYRERFAEYEARVAQVEAIYAST
ncbi:MAG: xylulokinase [Polyangiales bacterium]